jgi:uncharacterized membrane protein YciS (DUF1049 family)
MRFLCFLLLVIFVGAVIVFAMQNNEAIALRFFDRDLNLTMAQLVGAVYVLGMLTGWTVVGMLRRSLHRVTQRPVYRS